MHECEICEKSFVCEFDRHLHNAWTKKNRLSMIRRVLVVNSNKGGLGNSLFSALLAAKMKKMGYKTALLETSFSSVLPYYFNFKSANGLELVANGIVPPVSKYDYPYLSPALFMIREPNIVAWDHEATLKFIKKMIINADWGDTDIMIIDLSAEHTGLVKDLRAFFSEKMHHAVLLLDYKQASGKYAKAYVDHFREFITVLKVLLSPSKIKTKTKKDITGIDADISALPFFEAAYSSDPEPDKIIEGIYELYAPVLEEVSTACLSIF
ncbi:MAG: P-loop NTPase [bacterium]